MHTLTFVHPVTASVNFPFAAHFFHVGPLVRREVHEGVVRQPQLLENVQDLPCREENSPWETSSIFPKDVTAYGSGQGGDTPAYATLPG